MTTLKITKANILKALTDTTEWTSGAYAEPTNANNSQVGVCAVCAVGAILRPLVASETPRYSFNEWISGEVMLSASDPNPDLDNLPESRDVPFAEWLEMLFELAEDRRLDDERYADRDIGGPRLGAISYVFEGVARAYEQVFVHELPARSPVLEARKATLAYVQRFMPDDEVLEIPANDPDIHYPSVTP